MSRPATVKEFPRMAFTKINGRYRDMIKGSRVVIKSDEDGFYVQREWTGRGTEQEPITLQFCSTRSAAEQVCAQYRALDWQATEYS